MKRIFLYVLMATVTLVTVFVSGCNKNIELSPITNIVETNFYKTEADCLQGLTAAYSVLLWDAPQNQNAPFQLVSEVLADHCFAGGASATDVPGIVNLDRGIAKPTDLAPQALWYKYYNGIYRCNILFDKIPAASFTTPSNKDRFIGEAKFLRAYYYFDMVRLFGNVPLILTSLAPSDYNQKQATPEAVYTQISKDLTEAIAVLPRYSQIPAGELGRATSDAARALLMRVWLYYTGYYQQNQLPGVTAPQIIQISDDLIQNSGHDLLPRFSDNFVLTAPYNNNNRESVFELQYSSQAYSGNWSYRESANGNLSLMLWSMRGPSASSIYAAGWSFAPIDTAFYNQFPATDVRKAATFLVPKNISLSYTAGYQDLGIFPQKWVALKANQSAKGDLNLNYPNHFAPIRFSDVLLPSFTCCTAAMRVRRSFILSEWPKEPALQATRLRLFHWTSCIRSVIWNWPSRVCATGISCVADRITPVPASISTVANHSSAISIMPQKACCPYRLPRSFSPTISWYKIPAINSTS
jgi:starch-binding outer membrane protein, SusD/RagB family